MTLCVPPWLRGLDLLTGRLNGWGFVQFASQDAAERACELTDMNFMGRDLFIGPAGSKQGERPSGDPVQGCWFCLSSSTADTSLIVSIGESQILRRIPQM